MKRESPSVQEPLKREEFTALTERERREIPDSWKWRIEELFPSWKDWEEERRLLEKSILSFAPPPAGWNLSGKALAAYLEALTALEKRFERVYAYAHFQSDTDLAEPKSREAQGAAETLATLWSTTMAFLEPALLRTGKGRVQGYLEETPALAPYKHMLEDLFRRAPHILSTPQERLLSSAHLFSETPEKAAEQLNDVEIPPSSLTLVDGTTLPLTHGAYLRYRGDKERENRIRAMGGYWENRGRFRNTFASLLDGAVKHHLFEARARRFPGCLEEALFSNAIDRKVYSRLIESVKKNLPVLDRYLGLKQRLLKLERLRYEDLYASAVPQAEMVFSWEKAREMVVGSMAPLGDEYTTLLKSSFQEGWMDRYPNKNKRSGAYCNGSVYDHHPYVLLNFSGEFDAVSTMAHELGHALHSSLANRHQPQPTSGYPIFLAEIASLLNESLLLQGFLENPTTPPLFKLFLLDQALERFRATVVRQTLFADFELQIHRKVEEGGTLTAEFLDNLYLELTRSYYGEDRGVMEVGDFIRHEWSGIPHFYYRFYVYQYSTGYIAASAFTRSILQGGEEEREAYLGLLKSGGRDYPLRLLREAGVDLTKPQPYEQAFLLADALRERMENEAAALGLS